ncbi:hypothetical protein IGI04_014288 [Brassica rapa subsp. trilocularis]|uniref:WRKY domain-containing protein n=1 Tax=Brassica rapa subsp. trilocularis TaxID=1813537 RepID=A0ABQ7MQ12_BRACM|nr:hypothetical protein IGI04_014288 [Brassica rapa subsp. trilocularis]
MHHRGIQESDDEEDETYNDVVPESPSSCEDSKISKPTPKKSRRNMEKRVVSVPIADVEGSKSRGEVYPPSDSWAWRKYGQKPIKAAKKEENMEEEDDEEEEEVTAAAEEPVGLDLSHVDSPLLLGGCYGELNEFGWFYDASISSSSGSSSYGGSFLDVTLESGFSVGGEEDESLYGDLGDLPDCASVFRRGTVATEEQRQRCDFGAVPFCDSSR